MDVGPDGFITPKRPDRGNEAGALGIVARRESNRGELSDLGIGHKREKVITALIWSNFSGATSRVLVIHANSIVLLQVDIDNKHLSSLDLVLTLP